MSLSQFDNPENRSIYLQIGMQFLTDDKGDHDFISQLYIIENYIF